MIPLERFLSSFNYTICPNYRTKHCELHCGQCDIPICTICSTVGKHLGHKVVDIFENFESKKDVLKRDLEELEKSIFPKYQESAAIIKTQRTNQHEHFQKLTADLNKQGEILHGEINTIIQSKQSEIDDMDAQQLAALGKQEAAVHKTISEIKQAIQDLKSLLNTNDVGYVSKYKSQVEKFRILPPKLEISLPSFLPQTINREQLLKQLGSLSPLTIETEEKIYTLPAQGAESTPARILLNDPRLITDIPTGHKELFLVSCLTDDEIWTRGHKRTMTLHNLKGELRKSVRTKSGNIALDLTVTRSGNLVYADERSINLVRDTHIQKLITLRGWRPCGLCSTVSGDLLVSMINDDYDQIKVVRYSGSKEKQTIQWDEQGKPLFSSRGHRERYLSENRNLDICAIDDGGLAVVVLSAAGKFRFRYTGPPSTIYEPLNLYGIATDSQANILASDLFNGYITIIDQDGHFLRYIGGFQNPYGICVDSRDHLFVAESFNCIVKKIQYYV